MPGASPTEAEVTAEAERQIKEGLPIETGTPRTTINICAGSPVPAGWIVTDDEWSPTSCGNPTQIVYNVQTITDYASLPVGATLNVCAYAPTPSGWVDVNYSWSPGSCGHPTTIVNNVKTIRRVS
jgi:hypothetical protein